MAELELRAGDIVLVRSQGLFGWLIRQSTRTAGERRTRVNHCGVMVDQQDIVEALAKVRRHALADQYGSGNRAQIAIYRWRGLDDTSADSVAAKAAEYVGRSYGWLKIVAHGLDRLAGGRYLFRRLAMVDNYPICSWVVAYAFDDIGKDFGVPPNAADPDHIWDYCVEHDASLQFEQLYPLSKLG